MRTYNVCFDICICTHVIMMYTSSLESYPAPFSIHSNDFSLFVSLWGIRRFSCRRLSLLFHHRLHFRLTLFQFWTASWSMKAAAHLSESSVQTDSWGGCHGWVSMPLLGADGRFGSVSPVARPRIKKWWAGGAARLPCAAAGRGFFASKTFFGNILPNIFGPFSAVSSVIFHFAWDLQSHLAEF